MATTHLPTRTLPTTPETPPLPKQGQNQDQPLLPQPNSSLAQKPSATTGMLLIPGLVPHNHQLHNKQFFPTHPKNFQLEQNHPEHLKPDKLVPTTHNYRHPPVVA